MLAATEAGSEEPRAPSKTLEGTKGVMTGASKSTCDAVIHSCAKDMRDAACLKATCAAEPGVDSSLLAKLSNIGDAPLSGMLSTARSFRERELEAVEGAAEAAAKTCSEPPPRPRLAAPPPAPPPPRCSGAGAGAGAGGPLPREASPRYHVASNAAASASGCNNRSDADRS